MRIGRLRRCLAGEHRGILELGDALAAERSMLSLDELAWRGGILHNQRACRVSNGNSPTGRN